MSNAPSISVHSRIAEEEGIAVIHPSLHSALIDEEHYNPKQKSQDSNASDIQKLIPEFLKMTERLMQSQSHYESMQREIETLKRRESMQIQSIAALSEQLETLNPKVAEVKNEKEELERKMEVLQNENRRLSSKNIDLTMELANKALKTPTNPEQEGGGLEWVPDIPEKLVGVEEHSDGMTKRTDMSLNATQSASLAQGESKNLESEGERTLHDNQADSLPLYSGFKKIGEELNLEGERTLTDHQAGTALNHRSKSIIESYGILDVSVTHPTNGGGLETTPKSEFDTQIMDMEVDIDAVSVNSSLLNEFLS